MINIDRLDFKNGRLNIEVSIEDNDYFANVFLDKIIVDTQSTYTSSGPSQTPLLNYQIATGQKKFQISFQPTNFNINEFCGTFFIVYITSTGNATTGTPADLIIPIEKVGIYDKYSLFQELKPQFRLFTKTGIIPKKFIDLILLIRYIDYSIIQKQYANIIHEWHNIIDNFNNIIDNG